VEHTCTAELASALLSACNALDDECIRHPGVASTFETWNTTQNKKAFTMLCSNNTSMTMVTHVFVFFIGALSDTNSIGDGVGELALLIVKKPPFL
jgi:hypothetical protein